MGRRVQRCGCRGSGGSGGRLTGSGASARKGSGGGTLRAKRRSVGDVGVFTEGRAAFYMAEAG
jgi:hypothetical protein